MSGFASSDLERLTKLLANELEAYKKIRKLSEAQTELIAKDDIEALNNSLEKREKLIEKIKGLHQEKDPLMQSYASFTSGEKQTDEDIEKLNKRIHEQIAACNELNDTHIAAMKEKEEEQAKRIDEQSAKRKGIGGYAQAVPTTSEVFDKKT